MFTTKSPYQRTSLERIRSAAALALTLLASTAVASAALGAGLSSSLTDEGDRIVGAGGRMIHRTGSAVRNLRSIHIAEPALQIDLWDETNSDGEIASP